MSIADLNKKGYPPFSVLMSLYYKEKAEYLEACLESLLKQTCPAQEWVIVKDGPLTESLDDILEEYIKKYPGLITIVPISENVGLGLALRKGIEFCKYELVARMDTDDIAKEDRFEKQLQLFVENPELDICGGQIVEFEDSISNIVAKRTVPLNDKEIKKYQKRRDAFNHMTVMYKKKSVLNAGNYQSALLMEDTLLWANMIMSGSICKNLPDDLVYVRIGKDMYQRRGGFEYFKKYKLGRKKVKETGFIGWYDYYVTLVVQFIVALIPSSVRGLIFKKILHR